MYGGCGGGEGGCGGSGGGGVAGGEGGVASSNETSVPLSSRAGQPKLSPKKSPAEEGGGRHGEAGARRGGKGATRRALRGRGWCLCHKSPPHPAASALRRLPHYAASATRFSPVATPVCWSISAFNVGGGVGGANWPGGGSGSGGADGGKAGGGGGDAGEAMMVGSASKEPRRRRQRSRASCALVSTSRAGRVTVVGSPPKSISSTCAKRGAESG